MIMKIAAVFALAGAVGVQALPAAAATTKYLITFGDSYSQTGFNPSGTQPSAGNILGNPPYPGWTTANGDGSNWIGYLVKTYNTSLTLSYNFASGGATTDASLIASFAPYPTVLSFVDQVNQFVAGIGAGKSGAGPWNAQNSLFGIWMGVNDVGNGWSGGNWDTLLPKVIDQYMAQVQILYNHGARRFVFLTVPPIYRTPNQLQWNVAGPLGTAINQYSAAVQKGVNNFKAKNAGVRAYVFNTTQPFNTVLDNPKAYGAQDATCYSTTGTQCLWFNDYHPGTAIHKKVAAGVAALVGKW